MKRILITRPRLQSDDFAEELRNAGFEPVFFPVIEIQPITNNVALERALAKLDCYDWLVFTSVNAVDVVFDLLGTAMDSGDVESMISSAGPRCHSGSACRCDWTKDRRGLTKRGITPDFVPEEYVAESILPGLGDLVGKWVLLPRAEIARKALPEAIFEAGGIPHEMQFIRRCRYNPAWKVSRRWARVDIVTLTSPSTVHNFTAIARQHGLDPLSLPRDPLVCLASARSQSKPPAKKVLWIW